jgi:glycosyltransferase involved in cell wall biosynthesis
MGCSVPSQTLANLSIQVWDPNGVNSYGQEVASLIAEVKGCVELWTPRDIDAVVSDGRALKLRKVLATSASREGLVRHGLARFLQPIHLLIRSVRKRSVIVLTWTRGPWENYVFRVATRFLPVAVVHHNPRFDRSQSRFRAGGFEALLKSCAAVLVHSHSFVRAVALKSAPIVVDHPPYYRWVDKYFSGSRAGRASSAKTWVLFLGALRNDKGLDHLDELIAGLDPERFAVRIVGTGVLPQATESALRDSSIETDVVVSPEPVADREIARALAMSDVMLAPYVAATVSGTIILACTVGLPTLAYREGAIAEYLVDDAMSSAASPASMLRLLEEWTRGRPLTFRQRPAELLDAACDSWASAILATRLAFASPN